MTRTLGAILLALLTLAGCGGDEARTDPGVAAVSETDNADSPPVSIERGGLSECSFLVNEDRDRLALSDSINRADNEDGQISAERFDFAAEWYARVGGQISGPMAELMTAHAADQRRLADAIGSGQLANWDDAEALDEELNGLDRVTPGQINEAFRAKCS